MSKSHFGKSHHRKPEKGTNDDDVLVGTDRNDKLIGKGGDDLLTGGKGSDWIDGGKGMDTALYSGAIDEYVILDWCAGSTVVIDLTANRDGVDTLKPTSTR